MSHQATHDPAATGGLRPDRRPVLHASRWSFAMRIGEQLRVEGVRYCAWKGNPKLERFERGAGDLDLLVDRHQFPTLIAALAPFGFRLALAAPGFDRPGVQSLVAPHPTTGALVHLHVHFRLLLGDAGHTQFHLPLEHTVLATAAWAGSLRVPSPAFAFILHVLHQTLRHSPQALLGARDPRWLREADLTLAELETRADPAAVRMTLAHHLPTVAIGLLDACAASLRPGASPIGRLVVRARLSRALRSHRTPAGTLAVVSRVWSRLRPRPGAPQRRPPGRARPSGGGIVIALVGADGAGKSTCARALQDWFGEVYRTAHAHLGRPPRGAWTLLSGAVLKVASFLQARLGGRLATSLRAHAELMRTIGTARDRRRLHARVHRLAAAGAIVITERHPASEHEALAGPSEQQGIAGEARSRLADRLRQYERALYAAMARPDLTLVLRVAPDIAVQRKPEEPASYVRRRAELVWQRPWDRRDERPIDAGRPLSEVLAELRQRAWEAL